MQLKIDQVKNFKEMIWDFYHQHGRQFAWRNVDNPYHVFISEVMLQQTQTSRVEHKFEEFIAAFSSFQMLSESSLADVLSVWQGLGYNRRGKYLHQAAQKIVACYDGVLPDEPEILVKLPGIGPATASSVAAFAYNRPTVFIETNIRSVFIHTFFHASKKGVTDKEIIALVEQTLDHDNPREWYYALMDYGVYLKKNIPNPSRRSKHYTKQSKFEGSDRQIRGKIIKLLIEKKTIKYNALIDLMQDDVSRVQAIIDGLIHESLIHKSPDQIISIQ